jgi:hypothetical protein
LINYFYNSKIIDGFAFLFIGVSIGLYGPLALGRPLPFSSPIVSSEIYDLDIIIFDLPSGALPNINGISENYQIYIEPLEDDLIILVASPNVGSNDFSIVSELVKYPETILSLIRIENSSLILVDQIILSELDKPLHHVKGLFASQNQYFISSIGIDDEGCQSLQLHKLLILTDYEITVLENTLIFESTPKLCGTHNPLQSGGRISLLDEDSLLLTVGDFRMGPSSIAEEVGYDGRPIEMIFPNTYGMIISINLDDYNYEPYSIGHRNPQGLFVDENTGKIWSSEHGPSGGGELNLIVKGNDYGWPDKTLGIPYGPNFTGGNWNSDRWSNHDGFINPIFSWIPSIAPSELVVYYGDEFEFWNGDILLSTLRDTSIRRLRLDEDRVLYDERIFVGERIRDLSILVDGRILMSFDNGQIGIISRLEN